MECRPLEIKVMHAKDLKDVNVFSKMDVYVVVSLAGDPRTMQKTPVDRDGGTSPKWNHSLTFTIDEVAAQQSRLTLLFLLKSDRSLGDKDIGEVHVPVKELLDSTGEGKSNKEVSYQVRTPSGKPKGTLSFSYKFGEKYTAAAPTTPKKAGEPVTAYPAAAGASSPYPPPGGYYPPPPPAVAPHPHRPPAGYPPPQAAGYGYPPQPMYPPAAPGYGYPPPYGYAPVQQQQQQPPKKSKFGLGLGLGAGLLGGLLVGDMLSDASETAYEAGYDAGFDDFGGGFDF